MAKILIVENDKNTLSGLLEILNDEGYDVVGVDCGSEGLKRLKKEPFDVLLTDLRMPDISGMELYEQSKTLAPEMKTIVMTAYSTVKNAVESMKLGVYEYLTKPLDLDELFVTLKKAVNEKTILAENQDLKNKLKDSFRFENFVGNSEVMRNVFRIIEKVARSQSTVLIRGESGVGKELVARAIHYNSARADKPLVEISCASLPETLLESELFGYEKGAFTGAANRKSGRFEIAQGGTLFLDEIGEISENVQTKLLRVLQEKEISRLGGTQSIKVDVRVIAATNRDLEAALRSGKIREDLYYRLNVIPIFVPPLRERKDDIPLLVRHFLDKFKYINQKPDLTLAASVLDLCMSYHWPGNVRELENAIENAVVLSDGPEIQPNHFPFHIYTPNYQNMQKFVQNTSGVTYREKTEFAERMILKSAIEEANGNKSVAAKKLKISLRTMRYKIKKHKL